MLSADAGSVVIDLGSYTTKAGLASERNPRTIIRTFACECDGVADSQSHERHYIYPVQSDIVSDWNAVKEIMDDILHTKLSLCQFEHPILITGLPFLFRASNGKANKERMTQIVFEDLCAPGVYFQDPAALAVVSTGRCSGCVISLGHTHSYIAPIYEGQPFRWDPVLLPVGGERMTNNVIQQMNERGFRPDPFTQRDIARQIIETQAYATKETNPDVDDSFGGLTEYILPDGSPIQLGSARPQWAEVLFQPFQVNEQNFTLAEKTIHAILQSDPTIRRDLCSNVDLVGGTSLLPGLAERVAHEVTTAAAGYSLERLRVNALPDRQYGSWLGGAAVASASSFDALMISRAEYDECGPDIVHSKCC